MCSKVSTSISFAILRGNALTVIIIIITIIQGVAPNLSFLLLGERLLSAGADLHFSFVSFCRHLGACRR
jgi:hypothetical protein